MPYTTEGKNAMLNYLASIATHVALHTGAPSTRRPNEVEGGSPAYVRLPNPWQQATAGRIEGSAQPRFDVPPSTEVNHVGFWSAEKGGICYAHAAIPAEVFNAQGTYLLTSSHLDLNKAE